MELASVEGQTIIVKESFVDDFTDEPLILSNEEAGPLVTLYSVEKEVIAEQIAIPDHEGDFGEWAANIPIPVMNLVEKTKFLLVWMFRTADNETHKIKHSLYVSPATEHRKSDIVVVTGKETKMQVTLPFVYVPTIPEKPANVSLGIPATPQIMQDAVRFALYRNNISQYTNAYLYASDLGVSHYVSGDSTTFTIPATVGPATLEPLLLTVEHIKVGMEVPTIYTYKVWAITPQILVAVSQIEDFINKARLENVIPELDYTVADIIQYLQRGLSLFNSLPPSMTSFNGTNMKGQIAEMWYICSTYYALASQLQAEGALAFDFSGQTVSLNVDRTPSIESALGRIESLLEQIVKPAKKLLVKSGLTGGDGSTNGGTVGQSAIGIVSVINAPTTKIPYYHAHAWRRRFF